MFQLINHRIYIPTYATNHPQLFTKSINDCQTTPSPTVHHITRYISPIIWFLNSPDKILQLIYIPNCPITYQIPSFARITCRATIFHLAVAMLPYGNHRFIYFGANSIRAYQTLCQSMSQPKITIISVPPSYVTTHVSPLNALSELLCMIQRQIIIIIILTNALRCAWVLPEVW